LGYVLVTVRVPEPVTLQVREVAGFSGWQLADLQRTLICMGAVFFLLSSGNETSERAAETLLGGAKLLRLSRSFRRTPGRRRPYAFRLRLSKSSLTTISLPESVCDVIAAYAELKNASRNQVYSRCLQQGLLIYLKAQAIALDATRDPDLSSENLQEGDG